MLIDTYESELGEFVAYANTWEECKEITRDYCDETDDECCIYALQLGSTGKYDYRTQKLVRI